MPQAERRGSSRPGLVADSADGQHDLRVIWISLKLCSQLLHPRVDQSLLGWVAIPPDLLKQHLPAECLLRSARQGHKQVELKARQVDSLAIALNRMPRYVDRHIADGQYLGILGLAMAAPQVRSDARDQHPDGERLQDIVVGARLEATDDRTCLASRGHHQYWHASGFIPHLTTDLDAVHSRQS